MLYESTVHPITIISTLPLPGLGALLTLMLFGMPLDVIGIIGIILLIGIVKKNGIMLVDVALVAQREHGLGTAIGSEIRQPLGYAIVGGLLVSQLLTLFTTPVVYIYMDRLGASLRRLRPSRHGLSETPAAAAQ